MVFLSFSRRLRSRPVNASSPSRRDCRLANQRPLPLKYGRLRSIFGLDTISDPAFKPTRRWFRYKLPAAVLAAAGITAIINYPADPSGRPQLWNWMVGPDIDDDDEPVVMHRGQRFNWKEAPGSFSFVQNSNGAPPNNTVVEHTPQSSQPNKGSGDSLTDKVTNLIVPDWARLIPGYITKLQNELSIAPGSLAEEIWQDAHNPEIHPEIIMDASVRISDNLCPEETEFLENRKQHTRKALAKYIGVKENDIHLDDVPIIAMCGSGGGLRALVSGSSSYLSASEDGLFDCLTYTAGVSGSCWLQTLYYSSLAGQDYQKVIDHLKSRLNVHLGDPAAAMPLLTSAPTNKYLLSGAFEKGRGTESEFGIVDLYGLLLGTRLLVPKHTLSVSDQDLKMSSQQQYIGQGQQPLPIYTAVRHEIPSELKEKGTSGGKGKDEADEVTRTEMNLKAPWFQWFEFTPYEFWCEEWTAGIPTWAVGRHFEGGQSVPRKNGLYLPEQRIPYLMGIWGSAFCATLSHYYAEARPILKGLTGFSGLDSLIKERDQDLSRVHPIQPAAFPNFARGLKNILPDVISSTVDMADEIQLMDSGMSNNLPIYPLLRPGRNVDIIIAFDTSADVRNDNWLGVVDGYVDQRGIKGWPIGAGWPKVTDSADEAVAQLEEAERLTEPESKDRPDDTPHKDPRSMTVKNPNNQPGPVRTSKLGMPSKIQDLSYCNIWVGSTQERRLHETEQTNDSSKCDRDPSRLVEEDWEFMTPNAGICLIYFPFLANKDAGTEVAAKTDPKTADFMSTWNMVYTPEQIDTVVDIARANYEKGRERTRRAVKAVYERKKKQRLEREAADRREAVKSYLARTGIHVPIT